jgi:4-nitrophenyl phosphatase
VNSPSGSLQQNTTPQSPGSDGFTGSIVFDLDGVVYLGSTPIPGAPKALAALKDAGWQILFATNNSTKTPEMVAEVLEQRAGFVVDPGTVITSAMATATYLSDIDARSALVVGSEQLEDTLRRGRITVVDGEVADAVVVGLDRSLTGDTIHRAARAINLGAAFVATNTDESFPTANGPVPGAGAAVMAVAELAQRPFVVCGKPHEPMMALVALKLESTNVWMVGDRMETDIAFAHRAGWQSVLALSGVSTSESVTEHSVGPDRIIDSIADLPDMLVDASKNRDDEG